MVSTQMHYYDQIYTLYTYDKGNYHIHIFGTVVNKRNEINKFETINSNKETALKHIDIGYILNSTIPSNSLYILPLYNFSLT